MKIGSWNIWGLNDSLKQCEVMDLFFKNKLDIIGIMETRVKVHNLRKIMNSRHHLWQHIRSFNPGPYPWILTGDYNCVRIVEERISDCPPSLPEIDEFNDCIWDAGLVDLHTVGCAFIWSNKHHAGFRKWMKLDRVLVNTTWLSCFPSSFVEALPPGVSDHSPLVITMDPNLSSKPKPFQFLNLWAEDPKFKDIITRVWADKVPGTKMFQLITHLKMLKPHFKCLNATSYSHLATRVADARSKLKLCQ
ncbi:uncharacterized protein LOC141601428 [Silene latifolia]|uniref:uncharacterized protein LOC141601428 n=1 Tax=Silene latifolia TaxID=37657 RepID=UPI003D77467A